MAGIGAHCVSGPRMARRGEAGKGVGLKPDLRCHGGDFGGEEAG